jgi:hypothetical protein
MKISYSEKAVPQQMMICLFIDKKTLSALPYPLTACVRQDADAINSKRHD